MEWRNGSLPLRYTRVRMSKKLYVKRESEENGGLGKGASEAIEHIEERPATVSLD